MKINLVQCALLALGLSLAACQTREEKEEQLARTHCGSCHQFPAPDLLPKSIWKESVLPQMAFRMGLGASFNSQIPDKDLPFVIVTLPAPMVTPEEWQSIQNYFARTAPDSLLAPNLIPMDTIDQFTFQEVLRSGPGLPNLSLLRLSASTQSIFTSDREGWLRSYRYNFQPIDSIQLSSPASALKTTDQDDLLITLMGIMDPNDQPKGSLVQLNGKSQKVLLDSLTRPVFTEQVDLNDDQQLDLVVGEFGNYTGSLRVFENQQGVYVKHTISFLPGARKVVVNDFNEDGQPDLLALFAQGDEHLSLYLNKGSFTFEEKVLLRFPPVFGSSYFEVADFNGDGKFDILYTNGDNMDYSQIQKPYHGLRLFLNDGKNEFKEEWFHAMPGCSQATARDFDQDGDLDIAAISYFPDYESTNEIGFLFLENQRKQWRGYSSRKTNVGRWLLMETGDIDKDGDEDILLGALDFPNRVPTDVVHQWRGHPVSILVLKNQHIN